MNLNDNETVDYILEQISKLIDKKISEAKYVKAYPAKVNAVGNGTADVILAGDTTVIPARKNKTNQTLNVGDFVYLFSPTNNLTNSYIAVKF